MKPGGWFDDFSSVRCFCKEMVRHCRRGKRACNARGPCPPFRPVFGDGEQSATVDLAHPSHPPLKSIVFRGLHIGMRVSASHNSTCYSGARASVVDGSSPNNDLYAPAKYPNCQKPYREATCVTVAAS